MQEIIDNLNSTVHQLQQDIKYDLESIISEASEKMNDLNDAIDGLKEGIASLKTIQHDIYIPKSKIIRAIQWLGIDNRPDLDRHLYTINTKLVFLNSNNKSYSISIDLPQNVEEFYTNIKLISETGKFLRVNQLYIQSAFDKPRLVIGKSDTLFDTVIDDIDNLLEQFMGVYGRYRYITKSTDQVIFPGDWLVFDEYMDVIDVIGAVKFNSSYDKLDL